MRLLFLLFLIPGFIYSQSDTVTILISYDGFRHDYVEKFDLENFKELIKEGVAADGIIPSYPSKTFSNHYSIVTGLEPGHHGLPANTFYNRELGKLYQIRDKDVVTDGRFYSGLPIWCYAQQNGLKTASFFWVGSEASIDGCKPDYVRPYNHSLSNKARIDGMIEWLNLPKDERPRLILGYFSTMDDFGHKYGPNAPETHKAAEKLDKELGYFREKIKESGIPVNLILVSDHGMEDLSDYEPIYIDFESKAFKGKYVVLNAGPFAYVYFIDQKTSVKKAKRELSESINHDKLIFEVPQKYKSFKGEKKPWTPDLIITAPKKHIFLDSERKDEFPNGFERGGTHGFTSDMKSMQGIFYANGPSFKHGEKIKSFQNIHIFSLLVNILSLEPYEFIDGNDFLLEKTLNQEQ
ncbi:alkaline phosphatase family protein [Mangrovivirga cuniculi]|uniref:Alkaline phosphatase family protein n=1 Tax=Mangrovivirga cuniculi TaxID=2715131 RepID=A0A4D7KBR6_9BACT|nr:ectonucleotide pyrophosphatase/phosphodiesterase [Mangrovivirga cuniculi]QCK16928.1 alkaline phosphatase family protein [Mangrovivirga cuniculi]